MKPVIGMVLVLTGLTTGYLVVTNKLPNSGTPVPPVSGNASSPLPISGHGGPNYKAARMYV